ncbi:MAG: prepilin-type N-terminal cleavage/methylation domain-containing protein [Flavobacteriia bacterium]|nr:prepilin-type N-terminal cleavage/methylation domain-containing protein [Flavobacteriia bacterium]
MVRLKGSTLVEVLIAVTILSIIVGIASYSSRNLTKSIEHSAVTEFSALKDSIQASIQTYHIFPDSLLGWKIKYTEEFDSILRIQCSFEKSAKKEQYVFYLKYEV